MKVIIGMTCAVVIVLLQLAVVAAAWPSDAELHLAPVDSAPFGDARPA
ncbi:MAG TPA: hypothetical protein VM115_11205 [Vicinamibacterales bacterium]|nr:hypothetical protein [Vicinamibacterales bacterium]